MTCIFKHVCRGILRNRVKTIITIAVSIALAVFTLMFSCNIIQTQVRLENLGDELPVDLQVASVSGGRNKSLTIDTSLMDKILSTEMVTPIRYTGRMLYLTTEFVEEEILPYYASLAQYGVTPANSNMILFHTDDELLKEQNGEGVIYMDGYDASLFSSDDDIALMKKTTMNDLGLQLGDEYDICVLNMQYRGVVNGDLDYIKISEVGNKKVKIVGTYETYADDIEGKNAEINLFMPYAAMLRYAGESSGSPWPSMAWFRVDDPIKINELKKKLDELEIPQADKTRATTEVYGISVILTDGQYIATAEPLQRNLSLLRILYPVVMAAVLFISFLVSYLLIQSRKPEIAIMRSLGVSKGGVYLRMLLESMLLSLLGVLIGGIFILLAGAGTLSNILLPILIYLVAYFLGASVAILLTDRSDVITILSSAE